MHKVLLVDNGTHYKKRLDKLLKDFEVSKIDYRELANERAVANLQYDLIVLSGAYKTRSAKYGASEYLKVQQLVADSKVPVIGLCYGAQLIAHKYGAKLSFVPPKGERVKGTKLIWLVKGGVFDFFPYYGAKVWASQRWRITELPDDLECLCASAEGVEIFKHKSKPVYGLQFHPEHMSRSDNGARIFYEITKKELAS